MISFRKLTDTTNSAAVVEMMQCLYQEDPASYQGMSPANFALTVKHFLSEPTSGSIMLFISDDLIIGYAVLVPYWSNEFGGNILFVDEIFVRPKRRGQGIAKRFLKHVEEDRPFLAVACALEVTKRNSKARALYSSLGFCPRENELMIRVF